MRALAIIFDTPFFNLAPRVVERNEDMLIETFLAQACVETFDVRILSGLLGSMNCSRTP